MKVVSAATLLLLLSAPASAKDTGPCAGVKSGKDVFGVEMRGHVAYVGAGGYLAVAVRQVAANKHMEILLVARGVLDVVAPVGTPGKIALSDGTVLDLLTAKAAPPISNAGQGGIFTQWILEFPLDTALLTKLGASPINAVQSEIGGKPMQFAVPKSGAGKLQKTAACLVTT